MTLKPHEEKVLKRIVQGDTYKEAAHSLQLSEGSVKEYVFNAKRRNGMRTTAQLVARFVMTAAIFTALLTAQPSISMAVSPQQIAPGQPVTITVTASGTTGNNDAGFEWSMNVPAGWSFTPAVGAAGTAASKTVTCNTVGGTITCVLAAANLNVIGDGVVATLTGTVPNSQPQGPVTFTLTSPVAANTSATAVTTTVGSPLTLTVTGSPCDLNSDGKVDGVDYGLMLNQALGLAACTQSITGNGCTVVDLMRIAVVISGGACRTGA